jgi:tRNA A-37 threonylcarbamoyl transferase component Bud32
MATLLERLREALAPDYQVERELASGGMGVVFLGRDVALDRPIAIKIIRPDLATATAAERFVREARTLASLSHPNIVPIHRAGEAGGLFYYVMDFLEAETLADRLGRGPLPPPDAVAMARDVLAALDATHRRGIVHRDVKPANIFLLEGRAVLADFGIAKATAAPEPALTADGKVVGSPGYMAPEQVAGGDVTPATDLYAAGLVLYEALTGTAWPYLTEPQGADWSGVPHQLVGVLRRALAWKPTDRWAGAREFRRALEPERRRARSRWRWAAAVAAVAALGAAASLLVRSPPLASTLSIRIPPFEVRAAPMAPEAPAHLGDSLALSLAQSLGGSPDLSVSFARDSAVAAGKALVLHGEGTIGDDGTLHLTVQGSGARRRGGSMALAAAGPLARWHELVEDSLASQLLLYVWTASGERLAADLPLRALPRTPRGMAAWIEAERLFARAQWASAYDAYLQAIAVDSTCLLCRLRLTDVARWIGKAPDRRETERYRLAIDSFPPHYQALIRASFAPHQRRWRLLDSATEHAGDFGLAWFLKGDYIFHVGPLDGYRRHDALQAMQRATTLWPDFAPAWEHLAWIAVAEGDSAIARHALDSLSRRAAGQDPYETMVRVLLDVCFRWRFTPSEAAAKYTRAVLTSPAVGRFPSLAAGARYLMTCDDPQGAVWLGDAFQHVGRTDLEAPGLLAQMYGDLALGRPGAARAAGDRLRALGTRPDVEFFLAELPAALLVADSAPLSTVRRAWPELRATLERYADVAGQEPAMRRRAEWMLSLLGRRAGDAPTARRYRALLDDEPAPRPFATLLEADAEAADGHPGAALLRSVPLLALDSAGQAGDPFFRAFLHLMRAQWHADRGDTVAAVRELRWHENNDLRSVELPGPAPEAGEMDWSLGTMARWRRARLLDRMTGDPEACACYRAVARLWTNGEAPFAARADTARRRLATLHCGGDE